MQGQTFNQKTRTWGIKIPKKSPDPQDRKKLLARVAAEAGQPIPPETKKFDLRTYRPLPGRVLLRVGKVIRHKGGIAIPDASNWTDQQYVVMKIGGPALFKVGDRVFLDRSTHKRPVHLVGHPDAVLVKVRRIGAVVSC